MNSLDRQDYERRIDSLCNALFHGDDLLRASAADSDVQIDAAPSQSGSAVNVLADPPRPRMASRRASAISSAKHQQAPAKRASAGSFRTTFGLAWLVACLVFAGWLGLRPPAAPDRSRPKSTASFAGIGRAHKHASRPIEEIRVGQRVLGENPDLANGDHNTQTAVDPATWRLVKLHSDWRWDDGTLDTIEIESLQTPSWIEQHRARPGRSVPLPIDVTEMGMPDDLRATVVAIESCPPIVEGPGHVVTTTVNHLNPFICELSVENAAGRSETIKPTGYHKFYSDTRRGWVSASDLRRGERLRGIDAPLTVANVRRVPGVERVYNMSIEGEHVYHVSRLGALVHNPDCNPDIDTVLEPGPDDPTVIAPPDPPEPPPGVGPMPGYPPGHPLGPEFPQNWPGLGQDPLDFGFGIAW